MLQMSRFHFLWLSNIPLCIYVYNISSLSSLSIGRHLDYFHVLANMNDAAVGRGACIFSN